MSPRSRKSSLRIYLSGLSVTASAVLASAMIVGVTARLLWWTYSWPGAWFTAILCFMVPVPITALFSLAVEGDLGLLGSLWRSIWQPVKQWSYTWRHVITSTSATAGCIAAIIWSWDLSQTVNPNWATATVVSILCLMLASLYTLMSWLSIWDPLPPMTRVPPGEARPAAQPAAQPAAPYNHRVQQLLARRFLGRRRID